MYDSQNHLTLEVKYKNGEANGKGKEYEYDGKLIFESEYLNGEKVLKNTSNSLWYNYPKVLIYCL